jgi:hypothetical protein
MSTNTSTRPVEWSDETLGRAISGAITVYAWGRPVPYRLTPREQELFARAKHEGYVLFSARANLLNAFRQWCQVHQQPVVYAERSGRYATVKMDILGEDEDLLLSERSQEKIRLIEDCVSTSRYAAGLPAMTSPVYSYIPGVPPEHAAVVAQAFVAIYRQNSGVPARVPALPAPGPGNAIVSRMQEARQHHYATTRRARDPLLLRWPEFCRAYGWPAILAHEARAGHARVEVELRGTGSLAAVLRSAITQAGEEAGERFAGGHRRARGGGGSWYHLGEHGLQTIAPLPTEVAVFFAASIARLLTDAGYFEPIDESWHE